MYIICHIIHIIVFLDIFLVILYNLSNFTRKKDLSKGMQLLKNRIVTKQSFVCNNKKGV